MIRLFATDFDNTLGYRGKVSQANIDAIKRLQAAGVEFCICTGRMPANVQHMAKRMGLTAHIVGTNGAISMVNGEDCVQRNALSYETLQNVLDYCERKKFLFLVYDESTAYMSRNRIRTPLFRWIAGKVASSLGAKLQIVDDVAAFMREGKKNPLKINIIPRKRREELLAGLHGFTGIHMTQAGTFQIEVMREGVDKWDGLQALAKALSISPEEIATIGDYDNDIPMLTGAAMSFAMGNAKENVKQAAMQTVRPVREDGFAEACEIVIRHNGGEDV